MTTVFMNTQSQAQSSSVAKECSAPGPVTNPEPVTVSFTAVDPALTGLGVTESIWATGLALRTVTLTTLLVSPPGFTRYTGNVPAERSAGKATPTDELFSTSARTGEPFQYADAPGRK